MRSDLIDVLGLRDTGHPFIFTKSWFSRSNKDTFKKHIKPVWENKPITYLEVGVFEGMSMSWMLKHVLTHKKSKSVGIDPWLMTTKMSGEDMENVMKRAFHNTDPWRDKCTLIRGCSVEVLWKMQVRKGYAGIRRNSVDLCMVDGSHQRLYVVDDANRAFELLKPGGWLIFDDVITRATRPDHVKQGVEEFVDSKKGLLKTAWKHRYMECYEKL